MLPVQAMGRGRWAIVGTLLVLLHALGVGARLAWKEARRGDRAGRLEAPHAARSRALAAALPPRGVIGFLSAPRPSTGSAHFDALQHHALQQLQYELSPRLLVEGVDHARVVVSFDDARAAHAACAAHGLRVVDDLGEGLLVAAPEQAR